MKHKPTSGMTRYLYRHPHPAVTVDCVIFGMGEKDLQVLLIRRKAEPHRERWALPGGFVEIDESIDAAARRELREETGVHDVYLEQLYTFGAVNRDPRERVISVAYYALVNTQDYNVRGSDDAQYAAWFSVRQTPPLAFDHALILETAIRRLKGKVVYEPIGFELLPAKFKLPQLQQLYETILERTLDKRNFRRKILKTGLLLALNEFDTTRERRPAQLHRFDKTKYQRLKQKGFVFEI